MTRTLTPYLGRRAVLGGLAAAGLSAVFRPHEAMGQSLVATPRQSTGPFYPVDWAGDVDNDLVVVKGEEARALGQITHILGRIVDLSGTPIPGTRIEIWQCDSNGRYRHPRDGGARARDLGFQGHGLTTSAADGSYAFRTIRPVPYPGRTPHIHFAVIAPGRERLVTQMYVAGEPQNARDGLLRSIGDPRQRDSVIVRLESAERLETGALAGTFDIVLAAA